MPGIKQKLEDFLWEFKQVCQKCKRSQNEVRVLFATKYLTVEKLPQFIEIASHYFHPPILIGENRVQEAKKKWEYLRQFPNLMGLIRYIMIGNLQKNKINKAIKIFSEIQAIDSLDLAGALNQRLEKEGKVMPVFLEVNISGEKTKHGFSLQEIDGVIGEFESFKFLKLKGFMTMAPYFEKAEMTRPIFRTLKKLAKRYRLQTSMGMSHDWRVAVEEGADIIRVGSVIFN